MPLDVRPDHLEMVRDILSRHVPDREVWAFGSRVTGKAKKTSGLDLCVIGTTRLSYETLGSIRFAFSESDIPYTVDVVDWAAASDSFRTIIEQHKVVLKEPGAQEGQ